MSNSIDGGQVYPRAPSSSGRGIFLRDHFAGLAMAAIIIGRTLSLEALNNESEYIASIAYGIADDMLELTRV